MLQGKGKTVRVMDIVSHRWEAFATRLYFDHYDIQRIERDSHYQTNRACRQVITEWLDGKGRQPATWTLLIKAVKEAQLYELAKDIEFILDD